MHKWRWSFRAGDRFANGDSFHARYGHDVPQFSFGNVCALQSGEGKQFCDLGLLHRTVQLRDPDFPASAHCSIEHARNRQSAEIVAVIEICDQDLESSGSIAFRGWNRLHNRIKQRP